MTQTTETTVISATRLLDLARDITLRLGNWQYGPDLIVSVNVYNLGTPNVFLTLSDRSGDTLRRDFIDTFSIAVDAPVAPLPHRDGGWLLAVTIPNFEGSGVTVSASVSVGGVR